MKLRNPLIFRNMFASEDSLTELQRKYDDAIAAAKASLFEKRIELESLQADEAKLIKRIERLEREKETL